MSCYEKSVLHSFTIMHRQHESQQRNTHDPLSLRVGRQLNPQSERTSCFAAYTKDTGGGIKFECNTK